MDAAQVIEKLELTPLDFEGGYFREIYRSGIPAGAAGEFCCATFIYYLMTPNNFSRWHKVAKDEIWSYQSGAPAVQLLLYADGSHEERIIGPDIAAGHSPSSVIPAGTWQAAVLKPDEKKYDWGLFAAIVAPGFDEGDFIPGDPQELAEHFPSASEKMKELGLL